MFMESKQTEKKEDTVTLQNGESTSEVSLWKGKCGTPSYIFHRNRKVQNTDKLFTRDTRHL